MCSAHLLFSTHRHPIAHVTVNPSTSDCRPTACHIAARQAWGLEQLELAGLAADIGHVIDRCGTQPKLARTCLQHATEIIFADFSGGWLAQIDGPKDCADRAASKLGAVNLGGSIFGTSDNSAPGFSGTALDDMPTCAGIFEFDASWTDKFYGEVSPVEGGVLNFTQKEPVGVRALIAPWNFPLYQANLKIMPALAMADMAARKPSEVKPLATTFLFALTERHRDLPPRLLTLVVGDGTVADRLTHSSNVHEVSFPGSPEVGRQIVGNAGASNLKPVTLELGAKSPCVFFDDTPDLDAAVDHAFTVMLFHKGEKRSEPTRFLIQRGIYDREMSRLIEKAVAVRCADPWPPKAQQGAQCNTAQFKRIIDDIEFGKTEAKLEIT